MTRPNLHPAMLQKSVTSVCSTRWQRQKKTIVEKWLSAAKRINIRRLKRSSRDAENIDLPYIVPGRRHLNLDFFSDNHACTKSNESHHFFVSASSMARRKEQVDYTKQAQDFRAVMPTFAPIDASQYSVDMQNRTMKPVLLQKLHVSSTGERHPFASLLR